VALSVEDHYVRVRTTRGEEMILMRLSDAIRETAPETGPARPPIALGGAQPGHGGPARRGPRDPEHGAWG
jgi:hypothetical protein